MAEYKNKNELKKKKKDNSRKEHDIGKEMSKNKEADHSQQWHGILLKVWKQVTQAENLL